jgi:hypothetical protein
MQFKNIVYAYSVVFYAAVACTGVVWSRYSMVITPVRPLVYLHNPLYLFFSGTCDPVWIMSFEIQPVNLHLYHILF